MKKFMTVLLVIAVMFTFSFGSAFAYTGTTDATFVGDVNKAVNEVTAAFESAYNTVIGSYVEATTSSAGYPISKEAWLAGAAAYRAAVYETIDTNVNGVYTTGAANYAAVLSAVGAGVKTTATEIWTEIQGSGAAAADAKSAQSVAFRAALNEYKAMVAAAMRSVDTSIFSDEKVNTTDEYTQKGYADAFIEAQAAKVEAIAVTETMTAAQVATAFEKIGKFAEKAYVAATGETEEAYASFAGGTRGSETGLFTDYFVKVYASTDTTKAAIKYVFYDNTTGRTAENLIVWEGAPKALVTVDAAANNVAKLDAMKASAKAALASQIATLQQNALTFTKTQKANVADYIAAATEVYNYMIDNSKLNAAGTRLVFDGYEYTTLYINELDAKAADGFMEKNVETYAALEVYAAKLAAETKDGVLVRDAAKIEKVLAAAKKKIYAHPDPWTSTDTITVTGINTVAKTPEVLLEDYCDVAAVLDEFAREVALEALEAKLEAVLTVSGVDQYYTKEAEAVKALYAEKEAAIKAATTDVELAAATKYTELDKAVAKIKKTGAVDSLINPTINATEYAKLDAYVEYALSARGTAEATAFKAGLAGALDLTGAYDNTGAYTQWTKWYAEQGARSAAEVKALYEAAKAVIDAVPAKAEMTADKAAVEALVAALPATITVADKDAVVAAAKAYEDFQAKYVGQTIKNAALLGVKVASLETALKKEITTAVTALPAGANAKAANKEAFKAAEALMTAFNDMVDDYDFISWTKYADNTANATQYNKVQLGLSTIKTAEFNAIKKAINALPINITEANRAAVEAITALYDAYHAEYSDATPVAYDARTDFAGSKEIVAYEEALEALEDLAEEAAEAAKAETAAYIASVEGIKIKANSSAKKGSITVKWTVDEEVEGVKYQVYKSTKAQKGYKKAITTSKTSFKNTKNLEKGTRYYYKVRAIAEVDGVTYYSDWSNKANRIAK